MLVTNCVTGKYFNTKLTSSIRGYALSARKEAIIFKQMVTMGKDFRVASVDTHYITIAKTHLPNSLAEVFSINN